MDNYRDHSRNKPLDDQAAALYAASEMSRALMESAVYAAAMYALALLEAAEDNVDLAALLDEVAGREIAN